KEETVTLPPGSALVVFTDGLTDRRSRADGDGHYSEAEVVDMLAEAVRRASGSDGGAGAVALAAETAVPGNIDDDMAILVVRSSPFDLAAEEETYPAEPIYVSEARRLAASTFASWEMDPDQAELACLLVSEMVTNAVLHASITPSPGRRFDVEIDVPVSAGAGAGVAGLGGGGAANASGVGSGVGSGSAIAVATAQSWDAPVAHASPVRRPREFKLSLRRGAESVWVEVFDPDLRLPRLRTAAATDEGGRGLYLVEQLATRWGSRPTPEGKAVWFEIPLDGKDT
ncbi:MAG: SpoIIE family protein phosphatase, partial [Trebonia sp.]